MVALSNKRSGRRERYPDVSAGAPLMRNTFDKRRGIRCPMS
jgi:hypothetical protein